MFIRESHRLSDGHRFLAQLGPLKLKIVTEMGASMHDTIQVLENAQYMRMTQPQS